MFYGEPIPKKYLIHVNKQPYDMRTLKQWLNTPQGFAQGVPHSRLPLSAEHRALLDQKVSKMALAQVGRNSLASGAALVDRFAAGHIAFKFADNHRLKQVLGQGQVSFTRGPERRAQWTASMGHYQIAADFTFHGAELRLTSGSGGIVRLRVSEDDDWNANAENFVQVRTFNMVAEGSGVAEIAAEMRRELKRMGFVSAA